MEICVLGSGSAGNSTAVRFGSKAVLIDAGFGPRTLGRRLVDLDLGLDDIRGILLTHLDRDHFQPSWLAAIHRQGIVLHCHERHLYQLYRIAPTTRAGITARVLHRAGLLRTFDDQPFCVQLRDLPRLHVAPLHLQHDASGTVGYRIEAGESRLGYATDLGRVPDHLVDAFVDSDLVALESNYDPPMQLASDRPHQLKQRIMGGRGHLSNQQALEALQQIIDRSARPPRHLVLLHLSRQCNCPDLVRDLYRAMPDLAPRLSITEQHQPTAWLAATGEPAVVTAPPPRQLRM
ncbi:MAG: MBL fold metallo-hydrolase, partial [Phycisphaerae bacterium]|nr:MBL fold metallo-hydrolase [Phycisphaerae bacterium]